MQGLVRNIFRLKYVLLFHNYVIGSTDVTSHTWSFFQTVGDSMLPLASVTCRTAYLGVSNMHHGAIGVSMQLTTEQLVEMLRHEADAQVPVSASNYLPIKPQNVSFLL